MPKLQSKLHDYYKVVDKQVLKAQKTKIKSSLLTKQEQSVFFRKRKRTRSSEEEEICRQAKRIQSKRDDLKPERKEASSHQEKKLQNKENDLQLDWEISKSSEESESNQTKMSTKKDKPTTADAGNVTHKEIPSVQAINIVPCPNELSTNLEREVPPIPWDFPETLSISDVIADDPIPDDPGISWDAIPVDSISWNSIPCEQSSTVSAVPNLSNGTSGAVPVSFHNEPPRTHSPHLQLTSESNRNMHQLYNQTTEPTIHSQSQTSVITRPSCHPVQNSSNYTNQFQQHTNTQNHNPQLQRFCSNSRNSAWNRHTSYEPQFYSVHNPMLHSAYPNIYSTVPSSQTPSSTIQPSITATNSDWFTMQNSNNHFKALQDAIGFGGTSSSSVSQPRKDGRTLSVPSVSPLFANETLNTTSTANKTVANRQQWTHTLNTTTTANRTVANCQQFPYETLNTTTTANRTVAHYQQSTQTHSGPSVSPPFPYETVNNTTITANRTVANCQQRTHKPSSSHMKPSKSILGLQIGKALYQTPGKCLTLDGIIKSIQTKLSKNVPIPQQQLRRVIWNKLNTSPWFSSHLRQGECEHYWTIHQSWIQTFKDDAS